MFRRKSFALLLILLLLLFSIPIIEHVANWSPTATLVQVVGFAITLIGIFGGAYFELDKLQEQAKQERQKENRQHRLSTLATIEKWVDEVTGVFGEIQTLIELSPGDKNDNSLIIGKEKTKPIAEKVLLLDNQWLIIFARTADIIGIKKGETKLKDLADEQQSLLQSIYTIGNGLEKLREILTQGNKLLDVDKYRYPITDAKRALDKIRLVSGAKQPKGKRA